MLVCFCKDNLFCEVLTVRFKYMLLSVVYKPLNSPVIPYFNFVETLLHFVIDNNYKLVLEGDFNIDMSSVCSSRDSFSILLSNVIKHPTRMT